jgi:AbrB family looped-hinge helix DNA binding protein
MLTQKFRAIKLGNSLIITIPALWRRSNDIKAGDFIEIELREHELIIRPALQGDNAHLYGMNSRNQNTPGPVAGLKNTVAEKEGFNT